MTIRIGFCLLFTAVTTLTATPDDHESPLKSPSPDGRFALGISVMADKGDGDMNLEIVEKTSHKVVADLGPAYGSGASRSFLVWSADSKWVACGTGTEREQITTVYFWNSSARTDPKDGEERDRGDEIVDEQQNAFQPRTLLTTPDYPTEKRSVIGRSGLTVCGPIAR